MFQSGEACFPKLCSPRTAVLCRAEHYHARGASNRGLQWGPDRRGGTAP